MALNKLNRNQKIELLKLLEERKKRRSERNDVFEAVRRFKGRFIVLVGGAGSGKSYEVADSFLDRIVRKKNQKLIALRKEGKQITNSCFPLLTSRLKQRFDAEKFSIKHSLGNETITYGDNQILFSGLDDVDKLKSLAECNCAWLEEADQMTPEDFREINRRLRGFDDIQIYISFNPVSVHSWLKKRFFNERDERTIVICGTREFENFTNYKDIDHDSISYIKKEKSWHEELDRYVEESYFNTLIIHSTYLDNKFLDDEFIKQMEELKEYDEEEYNIYALGMWGVYGGLYFDKGNVNKALQNPIKPLKRGYFEYKYNGLVIKDITWVDDEYGYVCIYEEPCENTPYVIGGDTAGEGSDYNTATCINNITGEDAATIRIQLDEDLYARQVYCLGKYYGKDSNCHRDALIGLEINFSSHPQKELQRIGYGNFYVREEAPDAFTGKYRKKLGFRTGKDTRPLMLSMLRTTMRESPHMIKDIETIKEMSTFVKNEKGRPEAAEGEHDDMIIARAITCYIRHQQPNYKKNTIGYSYKDIENLPEDYQEDYNNAPPEIRERMIKKWKKMGLLA